LKYELFDGVGGDGAPITEKLMELRIQSLCFSMVHRRKELITLFVSGVSADVEETDERTTVKFDLRYTQMDNQSEAEPSMAVLIRPRDLYYTRNGIEFKLERETEKEAKEREEARLENLTNETARMFQLQVSINKRNHDARSDVVHVESIIFLVQTLTIKIQFTHFLKVIGFLFHIGKILNQNVTPVHYVFEQDQKYV